MDNILRIILSKKIVGPVLAVIVAFVVYRFVKVLVDKLFSFSDRKIDKNKTKMIKGLINNIRNLWSRY